MTLVLLDGLRLRVRHSTAGTHPANLHYILPPNRRASVLLRRGGAEGIRTPDLRRAKAALSQLSYGPEQWASLESNQGPQSYQDCALAD
jgi:hypothetical protein